MDSDLPETDPSFRDLLREELAACGMASSSVKVEWAGHLGCYMVRSNAKKLSDQALHCAAKVVQEHRFLLQFTDLSLQSRFESGQHRRVSEAYASELEAWNFPPESIDVSWADDLQGYLVSIDGSDISDHQVECANNLVVHEYGSFLQFTDPKIQERLLDLEDRRNARRANESRPADRARAQEWLRKRRGLSELPYYDQGEETLSAFAIRLEVYCGFPAGSVLSVAGDRLLIGAVTNKPSLLTADKLQVLLSAAEASNLFEAGVQLAIVGSSFD